MLEIAKKENGATIFDFDDLIKVDINCNRSGEFFLLFNTSYFDYLKGSSFFWYTYDLQVLEKDNKELYDLMLILFDKSFNISKETSNSLDIFHHKALLNRVVKNRINYFSDDEAKEKPTCLSLTKLSEKGFDFSFTKSVSNFDKRSWILKAGASTNPKLAEYYAEFLLNVKEIADKNYEECQERLSDSFVRKYYK